MPETFKIWFNLDDDQPVRQLVGADPESDSRFYSVELVDPDEIESVCCEDCRSEHYQEGYDDGKAQGHAESSDRIERLEETIEAMLGAAEDMRGLVTRIEEYAEEVGVCV